MVTHKIAGITFRTESNVWLPRLREKPFEMFRISDTAPDVRNIIHHIGSDPIRLTQIEDDELQRLSWCGPLFLDPISKPILRCQEVRNRLRSLPDSTEQAWVWPGEQYIFIRDFSLNQLDIFYSDKFKGSIPEPQTYRAEYYVAANFQQIFASFLPCFSAILLHGSGIIIRERAALFLAPDEGGKTTVVKHSNYKPILSDDQIILRKEGNVVITHSTPFGGITSGNCQAKVGAFFMLEKASHFKIEPIAPSAVVQWLWAENKNYFFFLPKPLKKQVFEILTHACYEVPVYRMRFSKDDVDWDTIDAAME